jgi:hypothetical protein
MLAGSRSMLSLFLPFAFACGGSGSGGSSSVSGTVGGTSFTAASQIAVVTPVTGVACTAGGDGREARCTPAWKGQAVEIFITNREGATCDALRASIAADEDVNYARFDDLGIVVGNQRGELAEGKYDVIAEGNPVSAAGAQLRTTTATCQQDLAMGASAGTVTLTKVTPTEVAGTYTLTFEAMGSFTGSFDIPVCEVPDGGLSRLLAPDAGHVACTP